jgi:hypothetical protein
MTMDTLMQFIRRYWLRWRAFVLPNPVPITTVAPTSDRGQLFQQLHTLQARRAAAAEAHAQAIEPIISELQQLQSRVAHLQHQLGGLEATRQRQNFVDSAAEERLRTQLLAMSPECISRFVAEVDVELSSLRRREPQVIRGTEHTSRHGKKSPTVTTDAASIARRVQALLRAREQAESLKLDDVPIQEIVSTVNSLRLSLPKIETQELRGYHALIHV